MMQTADTDQGMVFNIQRYSVHDGPGIRTIVFLKGCPLRCPWCSNPEGISPQTELSHNENLCRRCGRCVKVCPTGALSQAEEGRLLVDRDRCRRCGSCVEVCQAQALELFGEPMTVDCLLRDVVRDEVFYRRSGGGLTVSGGDPMFQAPFVRELLRSAKEDYGLDTALETSLCAPPDAVKSVLPYVDHLFTDVKLIDSERHQTVVGVKNDTILENIRTAVRELPERVDITIRLPLVPGVNDDEDNIRGIARFLRGLDRQVPVEVLPYHEYGRGKYAGLGMRYPLDRKKVRAPDQAQVERAEALFREERVEVIRT